MQYKRVLTIAGSDPGGGAGIQADIKAISACGCFAMSAITAVTVQNTIGVSAVYPIPVHTIEGQIEAVLSDLGADAIKIGMLHSTEVIMAVKESLVRFGIKNIVLDPVMVSTSGHKLMQDEAIETLKNELIPLADMITPNIPEAEILLNRKIYSEKDMPQAAKDLSLNGRISVLLKAGHLSGNELIDIFYNAETKETLELKSVKSETLNTHGTGCTLSSAVAAFLAHGLTKNEAVSRAKIYISEAIQEGSKYRIGNGHGPVHHFYRFWK